MSSIEDSVYTVLLLGENLNCNVLLKWNISCLINCKFKSVGLIPSYYIITEFNNKSFTFSVPKRNAFSLVDFFYVDGFANNYILAYVLAYDILNDVINA